MMILMKDNIGHEIEVLFIESKQFNFIYNCC